MIFVSLKSTSPFYYLFVTAFAITALLITNLSYELKAALILFTLVYAGCSFYFARKKMATSFCYLEATKQYLLSDEQHEKKLAQLAFINYQSSYCICLTWRVLISKKIIRALLWRWHYDEQTWRQLQVHCKLSRTL